MTHDFSVSYVAQVGSRRPPANAVARRVVGSASFQYSATNAGILSYVVDGRAVVSPNCTSSRGLCNSTSAALR